MQAGGCLGLSLHTAEISHLPSSWLRILDQVLSNTSVKGEPLSIGCVQEGEYSSLQVELSIMCGF